MSITNSQKDIGRTIGRILDNEYPHIQKKDLADKLGVPASNFSDMLSGKRGIPVDKILALAEILGDTTVDYLVGRPSAAKSPQPDMQATVKTLGLSQKAVENIAEINRSLQNDYYPSSINRFLESDHALRFFTLLDAVALEASLLEEDVRANPHLDARMEVRRRNALKPAIFDLMKAAEEAAEALYNAEEIIKSGQGSVLRKEISEAQNRLEASADGQKDQI